MTADYSLAIAVDIGGTFTDIALHDALSGQIWRAKTPSVPSDPSQAFLPTVSPPAIAITRFGGTQLSMEKIN